MQEITDIVDRLYPIDDSCNINENGWFIGWKNGVARAKKKHITDLFLKLNNVNYWFNGDIEPYKDRIYEEVKEKEEERQRIYGELCKELDFVTDKEERPHRNEDVIIPDGLNTDEAKKIFPKAVKAGLMQPLSNGSGYQWNRSNAMLAYLCGKIYCEDSLKQDIISKEWMLKRGETFFPETALMSFFVNKEKQAIKNLGQSRLQMQRPPKGYKDIDKLFDEAT